MAFFVFAKVGKGEAKAGFRVLLIKYFEIKNAFRYYIKHLESLLPCVCSILDHSDVTMNLGKIERDI